MNKIGTLIRNLREQKGITQDFMAKELMLTQSNYGRLEKDDQRLSAPKLQKIAEILNVSIAFLFNEQQQGVVINKPGKDSQMEQYFVHNKEIYEGYINSQKFQIKHLQDEVNFLRELVKKEQL